MQERWRTAVQNRAIGRQGIGFGLTDIGEIEFESEFEEANARIGANLNGDEEEFEQAENFDQEEGHQEENFDQEEGDQEVENFIQTKETKDQDQEGVKAEENITRREMCISEINGNRMLTGILTTAQVEVVSDIMTVHRITQEEFHILLRSLPQISSIAHEVMENLFGKNEVVSDLSVAGRAIPLYQQDASEEALETITAELKMFGKRSVHKDTKLRDEGGQILEKDGLLYNCAFALCDRGRGLNHYCIIQLITMPDGRLYMYYMKGKIGDETGADESLNEWDNMGNAIREFAKHFQDLTGNEFEPWDREKKIQKQEQKFFPVDMDDGVEVRHGGLGLRQLGVAVAHCKLEPKVANFMKVLCSQEIYRYALMEIGLDFPDLPIGMVTDIHLKRSEEVILELVHSLRTTKEKGSKLDAMWSDFSQRVFTLMPKTRPLVFHDFTDVADNGAPAFEMVRDINVASRLIGDMSGGTVDDPLFDRYKKLGCAISPLEIDTDDYKMVAKYLEKTYEPVKVGEIIYGVSIQDVFVVELSANPSPDEMKKLPNKVLLWCGTRSSNLLRHLQKGFLPAVCFLPAPGYMFGKAIVCSDAAAEAARRGFTAVDQPEGFLVLAVASLGENITELTSPPENPESLEEKKQGVIGYGRKKTDESEHFMWKDDVKVPCGKLVPSDHKDSILEYNEYAVYDPQQVSIRFLVAVKFEEKDVVYDTAE